jgi:hypothetical protein
MIVFIFASITFPCTAVTLFFTIPSLTSATGIDGGVLSFWWAAFVCRPQQHMVDSAKPWFAKEAWVSGATVEEFSRDVDELWHSWACKVVAT